MKRFLKPTGRILTTAVFTSTAIESLVPNTAASIPVPDSSPSDTSPHASSDADPPSKAKTVIPPEAVSNHEFTQKHQPLNSDQSAESAQSSPDQAPAIDSDAPPQHQQVAGKPHPTEQQPLDRQPPEPPSIDSQVGSPSQNPQSSTSQPLEAHPNIAPPANSPHVPIHFVVQEIPDLAYVDGWADKDNPLFRYGDPSQAQDMTNSAAGSSEMPDASSEIDMDNRPPSTLTPSTLNPPPDDTTPIAVQVIEPSSSSSEDVLEATREWLDETLAQIVDRDRAQRETQFRTNLVESAHALIADRRYDDARRVADHPALTEIEREEILGAIAEVEDSSTYPFVSVEQAVTPANRAQAPRPSRDWLLARMNDAVSAFSADCLPSDRDTYTLSSLDGTPQASTQLKSAGPNTAWSDEGFSSGGSFLAGVGHQPPSMHSKRSSPPRPIQASQVNTARADDCTPSFGQNIGGITFATLSGYQWLTQFSRPGDALRMVLPLAIPAAITSGFGWRIHPIYGNRRFHFGIDFGAPTGTPVLAAVPGRIETSSYLDGYGLTIVLENQELEQRNLYAHLSGVAVRPGMWVEQGEVIGWVGSTGNSTGPHLHFEVHRRNGDAWVAVDPLQAAAQMMANHRQMQQVAQ